MVFRAATVAQPTTLQLGHALGWANLTGGQGRRRSLALGCPGLHAARRSGRPHTIATPTRVQGSSMASAWPHDQGRPVTRGTLAAMVAALLDALNTEALSRAGVWRILHAVDLKPHKRASWLKSHDADCATKAHPICPLDAKARASSHPGRLVRCCAAKTGLHVLERPAPTQPAQPGRRERREQAYIRHGTRVRIHALAVGTGQMAWTMGATRKATDFVAHLPQAYPRWPGMPRYDWVLDNFHTPWSLDVCRVGARWCQVPCEPHKRNTGPQRRALLNDPRHGHVLHCTPNHGAWLHQVEVFFGVLHRRFLARGSVPRAQDCARRLERFVPEDKARHAHPYRWTDTGEP